MVEPLERSRRPVVISPPDLPPPPEALEAVEELARAPWLALPPVALPDLHWKPDLESPSSLATATEDVLVLGLTSPSPHCGMGLALTDLEADFATPRRLDRFFGYLAARLDPRRREPALDETALDAVLLGGLSAWREREERVVVMETMEGEGNAFSPDEAAAEGAAILSAIPQWLRPLARQEFGLVGRGNHFLEVQMVEEVLDPGKAAEWGVESGQVVLMVHADSGHLGAVVGRLFAHRRKNSRRGRWMEWRAKLPYHLQQVSSPQALWERMRLFWPGRWVPIRADSVAGRLCRWALGAAANYAAAGRLALWGMVAEALAAAGGTGRVRLLWDAPHNGIWREEIGGRQIWVHRHNAARVRPGDPALLPGCERASSLLCVGEVGAAATLHSASHGAGKAIARLGRPLTSGTERTWIYGYDGASPQPVPHLSDAGLWAVAGTLAAHAIVRPVARLRPVATLKDRGMDGNHRDAEDTEKYREDL